MALVAAEMVEWRVAALVLLIDQDRMTLRESAALAVLAGQPNGVAFLQQRAKRQSFGGRPVDADAGLDRLGPIFQKALHGAVDPEAVRHPGDLAADIPEHGQIDAGDAAARVLLGVGGFETGPFAVEPVSLVRLVAGAGLEFGIE